MLEDYRNWPEEYTNGEFTLFGNNCAALAREFFDALLPLDQPLKRGFFPVALPSKTVNEVESRFPLLAQVFFRAGEISEEETKTPLFVIEDVKNKKEFSTFRRYREFEGQFLR